MKTGMSMTMPGFTAELSIYTSSNFRPTGIGRGAPAANNHIVPQGGLPGGNVPGHTPQCFCWWNINVNYPGVMFPECVCW